LKLALLQALMKAVSSTNTLFLLQPFPVLVQYRVRVVSVLTANSVKILKPCYQIDITSTCSFDSLCLTC